jgi:hypothetical protein
MIGRAVGLNVINSVAVLLLCWVIVLPIFFFLNLEFSAFSVPLKFYPVGLTRFV